MSKELEAFNEIIDKFAEQMMRANKEELTTINKTNAIEYLWKTPQVKLLNETLLKVQEQKIVEKALINGIWNAVPEYIRAVGLVYMAGRFYLTCFDENGKTTGSYPLIGYKITWWLKKDRSE